MGRDFSLKMNSLVLSILRGDETGTAGCTSVRHGGPGKSEALLVCEDGKISFVTVIVVMVLIVLIGLVGNSGHAVVQKIELQNAADSAAYSTALWQARGMNAITTTNHLMGELTALLVIHEAIGGPTLTRGGDDVTDESSSANKMIGKLDPQASINEGQYSKTIGYVLVPFDDTLVEELSELMRKDEDDGHGAAATIYDGQMTLKYAATICLATKNFANYCGPIGEGLKSFYGLGYLITIACDIAHIGASTILAKCLQEWLYLEGVETAARLIENIEVKDNLRNYVIPLLSEYPDSLITGSVVGDSALVVSQEESIKKLERYYSRDQVSVLAVYPKMQELSLPVVPEQPIQEESNADAQLGRVPSLWGGDDWSGPVKQIDAPIRELRRVLKDVIGVIEDLLKWTGQSKTTPNLNVWSSFGLFERPERVEKLASGDNYKDNRGIGYSGNLSLEDLEELPWQKESQSQWVRATYPYVDSYRELIRKWFKKHCSYSNASTYYVNWTNRYTIVESYNLRTPKDDNSQQEQQDDEADAFSRLGEFRKKIRQLRTQLEDSLEVQGVLESGTASVTRKVKDVSDELERFVDNDLKSDVIEALNTLGVPAHEWVQAVLDHQRLVQQHADGVSQQDDLDIEEQVFPQIVGDITLIATLDELLRVLEKISAQIDEILNVFDSTPHMYVMRDTQTTGKGNEPWTYSNEQAEKHFTLIAFAYRKPSPPKFFGPIFPNAHPNGTVAYAQAMFYNAGGSRIDEQTDDNLQPDTGWDTLNWKTPVKAREWGHKPSGKGSGDPWIIFYGSRKANENAQVKLNWQAKLVPVTWSHLEQARGGNALPDDIRKTINFGKSEQLLITH